MAITANEILWKKSALTSKTTPAQNGGRLGSEIITTAVKNNIFPDVSQAARLAGQVDYRKVFVHVASADEAELVNGRFYLVSKTPADSFLTMHAGTQTDVETTIASARPYGVANPSEAITGGNAVITLAGEHASYETLEPFRTGDTIVLVEGSSVELAEISDVTYSNASMVVSLTNALAGSFTTAAVVSSCIENASLMATATTPVVTSTAGMCGAITARNKGGIEQVWTLTFTSANSYTVTGDTAGLLSSAGNVSADYSPVNPITSTPYFTVPEAMLTGTFATADTIVFTTHPAAQPLWCARHIPVNCGSLSNDGATLAYTAEVA